MRAAVSIQHSNAFQGDTDDGVSHIYLGMKIPCTYLVLVLEWKKEGKLHSLDFALRFKGDYLF